MLHSISLPILQKSIGVGRPDLIRKFFLRSYSSSAGAAARTPSCSQVATHDDERCGRWSWRPSRKHSATQTLLQHRCFSYHQHPQDEIVIGADPVLDMEVLQESILDLAPAMAQGLQRQGYWTMTGGVILPMDMIRLIRKQSFELRRQGRYEQSWSEKVVAGGLFTERFDKEGVFACEPDGQDYDIAPDMIVYMSVLLQTLPVALNQAMANLAADQLGETSSPDLSNSSFNAKLAVTLPGGSTYPLHVDNPQGLQANDTRKLTCILYLNPDHDPGRGDGGELQLWVEDPEDNNTAKLKAVDLSPEGGRMVLFWSDEIPHEVLPTAPDFVSPVGAGASGNADDLVDNPLDRYALTLWIPTDNVAAIHDESSRFRMLRELAFPIAS